MSPKLPCPLLVYVLPEVSNVSELNGVITRIPHSLVLSKLESVTLAIILLEAPPLTRTPFTASDHYQIDQELNVFYESRSRILTIDTVKTCFGRSLNNDFLIEHESTSRYHATIEFVRGRFVIKDSSTNGTYIQISGRRVEFIHREEFVLADFGLVGFGWNPELDDDSVVSLKYRLLSPTRSG